ncbi:hypothetical protein FHL15_002645 [Xylaria flabelliformis]|uniref:F-box domain-containing protein n=1 Tax=Xylaria flabelliformis TaxID=2512241 RepID=A0A553I853_9PEZI|nr:hypothetical protein FHL15_002645 [Xylaria flabelliformis]
MPSAVQTVINIPELLQLILLQCDIRTLLTGARGVSLLWRDTIDSTQAIQKALFFQPDTRNGGSEPILNPLLTETFSTFFDGQAHNRQSFDKLPIGDENELAEASSLLSDGIVKDKSSRRDAFMRKDASWRRMLVRQPPVRKMAVWYWNMNKPRIKVFWPRLASQGHCQPCEGCPLIDNADPGGSDLNLTMGMLYDEVVENVMCHGDDFILFWNPERQADWASKGFPEDLIVYKSQNITLSNVAKSTDLIMGVKRFGFGPSIDGETRFRYPHCRNHMEWK